MPDIFSNGLELSITDAQLQIIMHWTWIALVGVVGFLLLLLITTLLLDS